MTRSSFSATSHSGDAMLLSAIRLRHVRRFGAEGLRIEGLQPGLNVLTRPNEFGKSTILDAVKLALFTPARSAAGSVRKFQPIGTDDYPYIELDFQVEEASFRLRKCYGFGRKGTMTRLERADGSEIAREADAETEVARLIGSRSAAEGPAGLLWLAQGSGLVPQFSPNDTETMMSLLTDEVTDVVGGDEARRVADHARAQLLELEDRRGKPRGPLKAALEEIAEATDAAAAAEAELAAMQELAEQVLRLERQLAETSDEDELRRLRAERDAAEEAARQAAADERELGHTRALIANVERQHDADAEHLSRYDRALEDEQKQCARKSMAAEAKTQAEARTRDAARMLEEAGTTVAARQRALDAADRQLVAAHRRQRHTDQAQELERLDERIAAAERLTALLAKAQQSAGTGPVDLSALRALDERRVAAEAALSASAPVVTVEQGRGVFVDGQPLAAGDSVRLTAAGRITLGDAALHIAIPGSERRANDVREARRNLAAALADAGCRSLAEAHAREDARRQAEADARRLREQIDLHAPGGLDALRHKRDRLADDLQVSQEPGAETEAAPLDALERAKAVAAEELARALEAERRATQELATAQQAVVRCDVEAEAIVSDIERLGLVLGAPEDRGARRAALEREVERSRDELGRLRQAARTLEERLAASPGATTRYERLRQAFDERQRREAELRLELARLQEKLAGGRRESPEAALNEARERRGDAERRRDRWERRRNALKLLIRLLDEEQERRRARVLAPVTREIEPMLARLFGAGVLRFDSALSPIALERRGAAIETDRLSQGTREQIALLVRFGFARLAAREGRPMPLILDDAFVYADDDRIERMFDLVHEVARDTQVIVLSCRERVFERLGGRVIEPLGFPE